MEILTPSVNPGGYPTAWATARRPGTRTAHSARSRPRGAAGTQTESRSPLSPPPTIRHRDRPIVSFNERPGSRAAFVQTQLRALADPDRARPMAAYMKTDMPFYGVRTPDRHRIEKELRIKFPPREIGDYRTGVLELWSLPHREEKYIAIGYACSFPAFVRFDMIGLYRRLIVDGAWWDLVDRPAKDLVGWVLRRDRDRLRPVLEEWIDDADVWLRRATILCQLAHKKDTDQAMLFQFCRRRARDKDFFIRKAIGWALREYSKVDPVSVRAFLSESGELLSAQSRREASKYI